MDRKELLEVLEAHFPTKEEHTALAQKVQRISTDVSDINDKLDALAASSEALDKILEAHPIPRIERVEKHLNLPQFVAATSDED